MGTRGRMVLCGAMLLAHFCMALAQDRRVDRAANIDNASGVEFVKTSGSDIETTACEEVCFTLIAKDTLGNVIRSWNTVDRWTTLVLRNSTANIDTSTRSWNSDTLGFSVAYITRDGVRVLQTAPNDFAIHSSDFDSLGQCRICLIHTKAERNVVIEVLPTVRNLNQRSEAMHVSACATSNYLVEITTQVAGRSAVYQMRPFELMVMPRDRYLNMTHETVESRFSARFMSEFDSSHASSGIFSGSVFITGLTNYFATSSVIRGTLGNGSLQFISVSKVTDLGINGRSNDFEILGHAPTPFSLMQPPDHHILDLAANETRLDFRWDKPIPADPWTDIRISRFDPRTNSDDVTYTWVIVDSISLTRAERIASNNSGREPKMTLSHGQIRTIVRNIAGTAPREYSLVWFVEATDGLSTTLSSPPNNDPSQRPGYHIHIIDIPAAVEQVGAPGELSIGQNYPNPFNPSTHIRFSVPATGRVTLRVFDILGTLVAIPVDELLEGGTYHATFDASQLPSGTYVYTMQFGEQMLTKRMTVMK